MGTIQQLFAAVGLMAECSELAGCRIKAVQVSRLRKGIYATRQHD